MTKYIYKLNFNTPEKIQEIKQATGVSSVLIASADDSVIVLDVAPESKADLDCYMSEQGYSFYGETAISLASITNFGKLNATDLTSLTATKGDTVYCLDISKQVWFDGINWVDALGNII